MRAERKSREAQLRLIQECRASGLTDAQWCKQHDSNRQIIPLEPTFGYFRGLLQGDHIILRQLLQGRTLAKHRTYPLI